MSDETKRSDSGDSRANGLWETVRRNGNVIVLIGVIIAGLQYQSAVTARMIEQLGARIDSLEVSHAASVAALQENQKQLIEQLGARMTSLENSTTARMTSLENSFAATIAAVQESQRQLAARMKAIEDDMRDLRAVMRGVLDRLARIESRLGIAPPPAPGAAAAGGADE